MKIVFLLTALVFTSSVPAYAGFVSFAFNPKTGVWGKSVVQADQQLARDEALKNCGDGCKTLTSTEYYGFAYMACDPKNYELCGWGAGTDGRTAYIYALQHCNKHSAKDTCRVIAEEVHFKGEQPSKGAPPWLKAWSCDVYAKGDHYPQPDYGFVWASGKSSATKKALSICRQQEGQACAVHHSCELLY